MQEYKTVGLLHGKRGPFTYRIEQELYDQVSEGDFLVCFNAYGYSVGEIIEKHEEPQDDQEGIVYRWAFQKVDTDEANRLDPDAYV